MWVVLGRIMLVVVLTVVVTVAVLRPEAVVGDGSEEFPFNLPEIPYIFMCMAFAALSPWLLLPVGSVASSRVDDKGELSVVTVLGTRRLRLDDLSRVGAISTRNAREAGPGPRGYDNYYLVLRAPVLRWVLVFLGHTPRVPDEIWTPVLRTVARRPHITSARARAMLGVGTRPSLAYRLLLGATSMLVGGLGFLAWMALVVGALVWVVIVPV